MIHPKYIDRRRPKHRYVFVHKSSDFNGRIVGSMFVDGQSEETEMRKAIRIAGAMGSKIRYGWCVDTGEVFGDATPEERAAAAGISADQSDRSEEPDEDAWPEDEEQEEGGEEFSFSDEPGEVLSEPYRLTLSFLESLTKAQLDTWAQENLGESLDMRMKKEAIIESILQHPNVEHDEEEEPDEETLQ